jgi:hypothetical protein
MQHDATSGEWDMKPYEQARLSTLDQLDQVHMSPSERRMARAYLRQAELLADVLMRLDANIRHAFGVIGRGLGAVTSRGKISAASSEAH